MSDDTPTGAPNDGDTPTERYTPPGGGDTPTERYTPPPRDPVNDGDTPTERYTPPAGDSFTEQFIRPSAGPADRFPQDRVAPGSDAPTERFVAPAASAGAAGGTPPVPPDENRQRRLIVILAVVGGLLLLAVVVVLVLLLTRGGAPTPVPTGSPSASASASPSATPTPTPTPTQTPTPTPTPTPTQTTPAPPPPPPVPSATVEDFSVDPDEVECETPADTPELDVSWDTEDAAEVFFGVDTPDEDASTAPLLTGLPGTGTDDDFPAGYNPFVFTCSAESHTYTITAVGADGSKDSETIVVESQSE